MKAVVSKPLQIDILVRCEVDKQGGCVDIDLEHRIFRFVLLEVDPLGMSMLEGAIGAPPSLRGTRGSTEAM